MNDLPPGLRPRAMAPTHDDTIQQARHRLDQIEGEGSARNFVLATIDADNFVHVTGPVNLHALLHIGASMLRLASTVAAQQGATGSHRAAEAALAALGARNVENFGTIQPMERRE